MTSATEGSSQYQPPLARITAQAVATLAAAAASATVSSVTAATDRFGLQLVVLIISVPVQDSSTQGHCQRCDAADDEHCEAINLRYAGDDPVRSDARDGPARRASWPYRSTVPSWAFGSPPGRRYGRR
jgi:hypothetical protein